jgi:hypothetical protein
MVQKLLKVLRIKRCSHQFSWPRRAADGQYYQVCLMCAARYEYDWQQMRRLRRVATAAPEAASARPSRDHVRLPSWTARPHREYLHATVRFRTKGELHWYEGVLENLSQSGLLVATRWELPKETLLELVFEMPEQVSGEKACNVLCQASIIRSEPGAHGAWLACSLLDYKFLRPGNGL